jgi:hypothetical protein
LGKSNHTVLQRWISGEEFLSKSSIIECGLTAKNYFSRKGVNIRNVKNSRAIMAVIAGLLFALVYVGLEFRHGFPERIAFGGDANAISVWHFPVIWLLAGILFYCVFYAVGTIRGGKVKERAITFILSIVVAVLLALYWVLPMVGGLLQSFREGGG